MNFFNSLRNLARLFAIFFAVSLTAAFAQDGASDEKDDGIRRWTTRWSFQDVDVDSLLSRLESIGIQIPIQAGGDVSVDFQVGVPLTQFTDAAAYRLAGRISAKRLVLENLLLEEFSANVDYRDGVFTLDKIDGRWIDGKSAESSRDATPGSKASGRLSGQSTLALVPRGDASVRLNMDGLSIGPLHDLVSAATGDDDRPEVAGSVTGQIDLRMRVDSLADVATWNGKADLKIQNLTVGDSLPLTIVTGPMVVRDSIVQALLIKVTSPAAKDVRWDIAGQLELTGRQRFQFQMRGNDVPLQTLSALAAQGSSSVPPRMAEGKLDLDLAGQGEWASDDWRIKGRIGSPQLKLFQQDFGMLEHRVEIDPKQFALTPIHQDIPSATMLIRQVEMDYEISADEIVVRDLSASIFGGQVRGSATLATAESGQYEVALNWQNIRPRIAASALLPFDVLTATSQIEATTSGRIEWAVPVDEINLVSKHRGVAMVSVNDIRVGKAEVGEVELNLSAGEGSIKLDGTGKLFGGSLSVDTVSPVEDQETWSTWLRRLPLGQIRVETARLDRLVPVIRPREQRRYRGTVSASVINRKEDANLSAEFIVSDFAIDGRSISRGMSADVTWSEQSIVVRRASGTYAGGRMFASGRWSVAPGGTRSLQFHFSGVDAMAAVLPLSETISQRVAGTVSGDLSLSGDGDYRIRGSVRAHDSSLFSVSTGTVDAGLTARISDDARAWNLRLSSIRGDLASGQIFGDAEFSSTGGSIPSFDMDSRFRVRRVDFGELISQLGTSTQIAHGRISGEVSLRGRRIQSVSDLSGQFAAELGATQASAVPGLLKANRFLGALSLVGTKFDRGELNGTIGRGAFNIDEFWLRGDRVRVFAEGRVSIADLRMDIEAVLATGYLQADEAKIVALAAQLALQAAIPVGLILELNRLFSNRTLYLGVTGPLSDPSVRLNPVETLRAAAGRFLVREAMVLLTAGGRVSQ
ncbi:AsmA family protein [Rubripirellula tenax]|nr:AsmA-like C-terminal region-containing protein [Rubripirellula tenax]